MLLDEAQDANPVIAAIVENQSHARLAAVGDRCQAIYDCRGSSARGVRDTKAESGTSGGGTAALATEPLNNDLVGDFHRCYPGLSLAPDPVAPAA